MNKYLSHILICIISISSQSLRANEKITELVESISKEQIRIDKLDKIQDRTVTLKSEVQSKQATDIYLNLSEKIVSNITMNVMLSDDLNVVRFAIERYDGPPTEHITMWSQKKPRNFLEERIHKRATEICLKE